jgi:hypothetical protein
MQTMKNTYGLTLREKREPVRLVKMDLSGQAGSRVVMAAAKRVMATHAKVIKAIASR